MANTLSVPLEVLPIIRHETRPGDTISALAEWFDVSKATFVWSNQLAPGEPLTPGRRLTIPPVSGVLYTAQPGDTVGGSSGDRVQLTNV